MCVTSIGYVCAHIARHYAAAAIIVKRAWVVQTGTCVGTWYSGIHNKTAMLAAMPQQTGAAAVAVAAVWPCEV